MNEISKEELDMGIGLCAKNSNELLKDAEALFERGSYGHALGLAVMAMEEYGKKLLLAAAKLDVTHVDKDFWNIFTSHGSKLALAIEMLAKGFPDAPSDSRILKIAKKLERVRQRGLYVDYHLKEQRWLSPFGRLQEMARKQIMYTKTLIEKTDSWLEKILHKNPTC